MIKLKFDAPDSSSQRNILTQSSKGWTDVAGHKAGDELITDFRKKSLWRWMLPLATQIHTSVIHLATSHRTDPPLSHVLSHLAPRHCSLLTFSAYYVSVSLFLLPSPHGAHQHTKNRLTVSLPRQSKESEGKYI